MRPLRVRNGSEALSTGERHIMEERRTDKPGALTSRDVRRKDRGFPRVRPAGWARARCSGPGPSDATPGVSGQPCGPAASGVPGQGTPSGLSAAHRQVGDRVPSYVRDPQTWPPSPFMVLWQKDFPVAHPSPVHPEILQRSVSPPDSDTHLSILERGTLPGAKEHLTVRAGSTGLDALL